MYTIFFEKKIIIKEDTIAFRATLCTEPNREWGAKIRPHGLQHHNVYKKKGETKTDVIQQQNRSLHRTAF